MYRGRLKIFVTATLWYRAQTVMGNLTLATSTVLLTSPSSLHGQHVRDAVFEYVEEIAVDIRIANQ
ncbi:hypothetical protein JYU09_01735 [bacterium AH-315-O15]|nr:hypothetical protein [bacterium AH-315-O15]